jgi:hypothetical protein
MNETKSDTPVMTSRYRYVYVGFRIKYTNAATVMKDIPIAFETIIPVNAFFSSLTLSRDPAKTLDNIIDVNIPPNPRTNAAIIVMSFQSILYYLAWFSVRVRRGHYFRSKHILRSRIYYNNYNCAYNTGQK